MVQEAKITTVLYVEDDADLGELFRYQLARVGYTVDIATNGEEAFQRHSQKSYDVIVLDQNLPRMSGLDILKALTQAETYPPIIMLTMLMDENLVKQALDLGAADFMVKDINGGYLRLLPIIIEKTLRQYAIQQEKRIAEDKVLKASQRFQHLVENISDIIAVVGIDAKLNYLSPSITGILGYTLGDLPDDTFRFIHPDDIPSFRTLIAELWEKRLYERRKLTLRLKHQDGSWRWMEGTATNLLSEPTIEGIVINLHDVTANRQAQREIERERNTLRTLIDNVPALVYIKDRAGNIITCNRTVSEFLGFNSPDDAIGKTVIEIQGEAARPHHNRDIQLMASHETIRNREETIDGAWYITNKIPLLGDDGMVNGLVSVSTDITARKTSEQRIIQHNHSLLALQVASASIASSLSVADVVSSIAEEIVRLTDFNICAISKWNQEENYVQAILYHDSLNQENVGWDAIYYLKDYPETEKVLNDWSITQHVISEPNLNAAERQYMIDERLKSHIMIPIVYQNQAIALAELEDTRSERKLDSEEILSVELLLHQAGIALENARLYEQAQNEIREREQVEASLRESEERFRIMFEISPIGFYLMTLDGSLSRVNQAFCNLLGYEETELQGKSLDFLVHPDDLDISSLMSLDNKEGEYHVEQRYLHKDGHIVYVILRATWLYTNIYEPFYLMGQIVDITDRKLAEQELNTHITQLELLHQIESELTQTLDIQSVLILALDTTIRFSQADLGYIALYDDEKLIIEQYIGSMNEDFKGKELESRSISRRAISHQEAELVKDVSLDPDYAPVLPNIQAHISLPLTSSGRMIGVLGLETDTPQQFTVERFEFLKLIAARISSAVDNAQLFEKTQEQLATLKSLHEQLVYQANHDPLTHLPNRAYFQKRLDSDIGKAQKSGHAVGLLYLDLDGFKRINDTMGHPVGDILLQQVANRLRHCVRKEDMVARMGGDEFTVVVAKLDDVEVAKKIANRILVAIREPYYIQGHRHFISASIGLSFFPVDGRTSEELLRKADNALYSSKDSGKNSYQLYDTIANRKVFEQVTIGNMLHGIIERGGLEVYYQPQVDIQTGKVTGAEALLRWLSSPLGAIPPSKFLPIANDIGLLIPISNWVIEQVCQQQQQWQKKQMNIVLALNIATPQFQAKDFVKLITTMLEQYNLVATSIELEVTEQLMLDDMQAAAAKIEELRQIGVKIALDDFGTGYSSLSYLQKLHIDTLKLDRSLVMDIDGESATAAKSNAILQAVISLASSLQVKVIAEGVETSTQHATLKKAGVDIAQGFLISPALSASDFEQWYKTYNADSDFRPKTEE